MTPATRNVTRAASILCVRLNWYRCWSGAREPPAYALLQSTDLLGYTLFKTVEAMTYGGVQPLNDNSHLM